MAREKKRTFLGGCLFSLLCASVVGIAIGWLGGHILLGLSLAVVTFFFTLFIYIFSGPDSLPEAPTVVHETTRFDDLPEALVSPPSAPSRNIN